VTGKCCRYSTVSFLKTAFKAVTVKKKYRKIIWGEKKFSISSFNELCHWKNYGNAIHMLLPGCP
jgi:hypothetical protein